MTPEEIVARLLYRDGLILVIDKPAGLAVTERLAGVVPAAGETMSQDAAGD